MSKAYVKDCNPEAARLRNTRMQNSKASHLLLDSWSTIRLTFQSKSSLRFTHMLNCTADHKPCATLPASQAQRPA